MSAAEAPSQAVGARQEAPVAAQPQCLDAEAMQAKPMARQVFNDSADLACSLTTTYRAQTNKRLRLEVDASRLVQIGAVKIVSQRPAL